MSDGSGVYVLCSDACGDILTEYICFPIFDTFSGEPPVVETSVLKDAQLFYSLNQAKTFRKKGLSKWARRLFKPTEISVAQMLLARPTEYAELLEKRRKREQGNKPLTLYGIPVEQMDMEGHVIARYHSIRAAVQITGVKGVGACCRGKRSRAGCYQWRYADGVSQRAAHAAYKRSLKGIRYHDRQPGNSIMVRQYTKNQVFVAEYPSITAAGCATGIKRTAINQCCLGHRKTAGGYLWCKAQQDGKRHGW